jgi:hypothetical protein
MTALFEARMSHYEHLVAHRMLGSARSFLVFAEGYPSELGFSVLAFRLHCFRSGLRFRNQGREFVR